MTESEATDVQQQLEGAIAIQRAILGRGTRDQRFKSAIATYWPRFEVVAVSESLASFVEAEWLTIEVAPAVDLRCSGCGVEARHEPGGEVQHVFTPRVDCPLHGRAPSIQARRLAQLADPRCGRMTSGHLSGPQSDPCTRAAGHDGACSPHWLRSDYWGSGVAADSLPDREQPSTPEPCECFNSALNPPGRPEIRCPRHGTLRA